MLMKYNFKYKLIEHGVTFKNISINIAYFLPSWLTFGFLHMLKSPDWMHHTSGKFTNLFWSRN